MRSAPRAAQHLRDAAFWMSLAAGKREGEKQFDGCDLDLNIVASLAERDDRPVGQVRAPRKLGLQAHTDLMRLAGAE